MEYKKSPNKCSLIKRCSNLITNIPLFETQFITIISKTNHADHNKHAENTMSWLFTLLQLYAPLLLFVLILFK